MIVTKRSLPRRTFLRGAGAMLGLPLLDAMVPSFTALAQSAAAPTPRLGFVYFPNGAVMEQWIPATVGKGMTLSSTLTPLAALKDRMVVYGNLARAGTTIGD